MIAIELLRKKGTDFMNSNSKKGNGVLYLTLAIIITAILCITIFPFFSRKSPKQGASESTAETSRTPVTETTALPRETTSRILEEKDYLPIEDENEEVAITDGEIDNSSPTGVVKVTRFARPVEGYVAKGFDKDTLVYSLTMNDYRVHLGIDVLASIGDSVSAFADGSILYVYDDPMNGKAITIDHGDGLLSHYFNLSEEIPDGIYEGALVHCGQTIAAVGDTTLIELSDENHMHFELTLNGEYINPLDYVEYEYAASKTSADLVYED